MSAFILIGIVFGIIGFVRLCAWVVQGFERLQPGLTRFLDGPVAQDRHAPHAH